MNNKDLESALDITVDILAQITTIKATLLCRNLITEQEFEQTTNLVRPMIHDKIMAEIGKAMLTKLHE